MRERDQVSGRYSAERAREPNNAQIMARSKREIAPEVAKRLTGHLLEFETGHSAPTVATPSAVDNRHCGVGQPARSPGS